MYFSSVTHSRVSTSSPQELTSNAPKVFVCLFKKKACVVECWDLSASSQKPAVVTSRCPFFLVLYFWRAAAVNFPWAHGFKGLAVLQDVQPEGKAPGLRSSELQSKRAASFLPATSTELRRLLISLKVTKQWSSAEISSANSSETEWEKEKEPLTFHHSS